MLYNPAFVEYRSILSEDDKALLKSLSAKYTLGDLKGDARNYEEMVVDFVHTSGKIEGNTYDRIDTDNLLRLGFTAGGKKYSDAVMLVNLRNALNNVVSVEDDTALNIDYLCDLHQVLMRDLLPLHEQGLVRTSAVTIGASSYNPPDNSSQLKTEIKVIFETAGKYTDTFEKAIYLHCNLAYLQYFRDGNKRSARMMQTATLAQGNTLPLFFSDTLIDKYQRATVNYYETGGYGEYVSFFKENYALTISKLARKDSVALSDSEKEEVNLRIARLPDLQNSAGVAHIFWTVAKAAIDKKGSAEGVNWQDVERHAIVDSLNLYGQPADAISEAICKYSPGVTSDEKRLAILDDVRKISKAHQAAGKNPEDSKRPEP